MAHVESVCYAGRTKKIRKYYTVKYNDGKLPRKKEERGDKKNLTSEQQKEINRKMAQRNLTVTMDANFSSRDLYITYTFALEKRPGDAKKFKAIVRQLLKRLRKMYQKAGIPFRYIWAGERGERGAEHIHMVQSGGFTLGELAKVWPYGWITGRPMDESGSYHKLAAYFIKYSETTMKTEGRLRGKRYNPSQNLIRPVPDKDKVKKTNFDPGAIPVPQGYYLDKDTVEFGVQKNGYKFLEYTLVLLPGYYMAAHERAAKRQKKKKRSR